MSPNDPEIILGILISEAALIVENAFRDVLGMNAEELAKLSLDDKFKKHCGNSDARLRAILEYVRENDNGGLPSMNPSRTILVNALSGISLDSNIRLLIRRVSDFAFYFLRAA